jgi:hypothetical protein
MPKKKKLRKGPALLHLAGAAQPCHCRSRASDLAWEISRNLTVKQNQTLGFSWKIGSTNKTVLAHAAVESRAPRPHNI